MSASEASKGQRFIDEKGAAYLRENGVAVDQNLTVVGQRLDFNDVEDVVHILTVVGPDGVERELQFVGTVFSGTQAEDEEDDLSDDAEDEIAGRGGSCGSCGCGGMS